MKVRKCKFKVGDVVNHKPDLYGLTQSTVVSIDRYFQSDRHSLMINEREVAQMRKDINARIETVDGIDYYVHDGLPGLLSPRKDPFAGYSITTTNKKMNTNWSERNLKLVK